jgi:tetratricopeptide (TPR) repeat protein
MEIIHINFPLLSILNITLYNLKHYLFFLIILLFIGCKNKTELTMERGIQYYEWDMIEKAVLEFKHVIHSLDDESNKTDYSNIKLLSRAHYNLAVVYAKKNWYEYAADEARKAFELFPTNENRKLLELIQTKLLKKTGTKPGAIDSTSR